MESPSFTAPTATFPQFRVWRLLLVLDVNVTAVHRCCLAYRYQQDIPVHELMRLLEDQHPSINYQTSDFEFYGQVSTTRFDTIVSMMIATW